jgi:hypothetical protein
MRRLRADLRIGPRLRHRLLTLYGRPLSLKDTRLSLSSKTRVTRDATRVSLVSRHACLWSRDTRVFGLATRVSLSVTRHACRVSCGRFVLGSTRAGEPARQGPRAPRRVVARGVPNVPQGLQHAYQTLYT